MIHALQKPRFHGLIALRPVKMPSHSADSPNAILVGEQPLTIDQMVAVAMRRTPVRMSTCRAFVDRIANSQNLLRRALDSNTPIYGVTTGFGSACGQRISANQTLELGENLLRYHRCGSGAPMAEQHVRGAMLCRLLCFSLGYSGVSSELLDQIAAFLNFGITPVVPSQGSVGASGDLTPMAYVASALAGEGDVHFRGEIMTATAALQSVELKAHRYRAKEPIAMLNGTPIMTGVAIAVVDRARNVLGAAIEGTALAVHALTGHQHHLDPVLFEAKPFVGQAAAAARLRALLAATSAPAESEAPEALQDPYSLRCAPHVLGVLGDALEWVTRWVQIEANGASDNPLIDPVSGNVLMGGNFYGGHIAFAMDALKAALSSVADLCDRQVALLVDPRLSRGLPAGLVAPSAEALGPRHGFKGLQITMSALTAESLHASMPAAVFSRSTESHNQDKVSLGTIAARDALRVCDMVERVVAIHLMAGAQACEIRGSVHLRPELHRVLLAVRRFSASLTADRALDQDHQALAVALSRGELFEGRAHAQ
jgi:histidine ammonia-lyase